MGKGKSTKALKNPIVVPPPPPSLTPETHAASGDGRKIRVLHSYSGRKTAEKWIKPGVYDAEDPDLFGLAEYLIENGHAEALD